MYAILYACNNAPIRLPWGGCVHKRRVLQFRELQGPFPGAAEMPVAPIRPACPRQPHPFDLRHALMRRPHGKQRP